MPTPNPPQDDSRAARLRENKRRSRARQKEYVQSLEKRDRETRQRQVTAAIEVQIAARKVSEENRRLRALLRKVGVPDEVVDARLAGEEVDLCVGGPRDVGRGRKDGGSAAPAYRPETGNERELRSLLPPTTLPVPPFPTPQPTTSALPLPPCKVFGTLSIDPAANRDAVPTRTETPGGGVQCLQAYQMLIPYATTEQKADALAARLEDGCVGDGNGGCRVSTGTLWGALDEVWLD